MSWGFRYEEVKSLEFSKSSAKTKIAIIGIGGCGCNTISNIYGISNQVLTIAVNTDALSLSKCRAHYKKIIGLNETKGRGLAGDVELGYKLTRERANEVVNLASTDTDIFVLIAGLGGGTGSGGIVALSEYIKETLPEKLVWTIVTLPFEFEGVEKLENAKWALSKLLKVSDVVIVNSNDYVRRKFGASSIDRVFRIVDKHIADLIDSIITICNSEESLGPSIDLPIIEKVTKNAGLSHLGIGLSSEPIEALNRALNDRYCEIDVRKCPSAVVYIEGPKRMLKLSVLEEIPKLLREKFEISKVYWGVGVNWRLSELKVVLLVPQVKSSFIESYLSTHAHG